MELLSEIKLQHRQSMVQSVQTVVKERSSAIVKSSHELRTDAHGLSNFGKHLMPLWEKTAPDVGIELGNALFIEVGLQPALGKNVHCYAQWSLLSDQCGQGVGGSFIWGFDSKRRIISPQVKSTATQYSICMLLVFNFQTFAERISGKKTSDVQGDNLTQRISFAPEHNVDWWPLKVKWCIFHTKMFYMIKVADHQKMMQTLWRLLASSYWEDVQ